jgi:hypothetical protein
MDVCYGCAWWKGDAYTSIAVDSIIQQSPKNQKENTTTTPINISFVFVLKKMNDIFPVYIDGIFGARKKEMFTNRVIEHLQYLCENIVCRLELCVNTIYEIKHDDNNDDGGCGGVRQRNTGNIFEEG